ncbi:ferritin family protein [Bacillus changyiensis]|uniref:ferritin family protein n=1 Tax=Bacillus changyiensis TaxID=3004103 RepID=UPI0022E4F65E|nr:ferritin family protein [Bacillus changyiensis]MDA1475459.1 rubrerythrin family protein [Bacillus changyiensis]
MPPDRKLINDIHKAINGEHSAILCYKQIAENAPTEDIRKQIHEIRQDEQRHFEEFSTIFTNLTGKKPIPIITEGCPKKYRTSLESAFKDEQETVDFYLDLADRIQNQSIKKIFQRAAADEQNHAVWFLFFLNTSSTQQTRQVNYGAKGALNADRLTLSQMLTFAIQDEYLAQARYNEILRNFGNIRTFVQIKEAELRHINALLAFFERYQVQIPKDTSQLYVTTPVTLKDAYASGVQGEIDNIAMYNKFLTFDIPADARTIFTQLRNASLNHLEAFKRGLERN